MPLHLLDLVVIIGLIVKQGGGRTEAASFAFASLALYFWATFEL